MYKQIILVLLVGSCSGIALAAEPLRQAGELCARILVSDAPVIPRPISPTRQIPNPRRAPSYPDDVPVRIPRRAPDPDKTRPLSPDYAPKDVLISVPYSGDRNQENFSVKVSYDRLYDTHPLGYRGFKLKFPRSIIEKMDAEVESIPSDQLRAEGVAILRLNSRIWDEQQHRMLGGIADRLETLDREILVKESKDPALKSNLLHHIRELVAKDWGKDIATRLKLDISNEMPNRTESIASHFSIKNGQSGLDREFDKNVPLESNLDIEFFVYRREVYNLLAQAEGFESQKRFIADVEGALVQTAGEQLLKFYRSYDVVQRLWIQVGSYRFGMNRTAIDEIPRESMASGREIVCVDCKRVTDEMGQSYIEVKDAQAIAVGKNALILAHEAGKAAFQLATSIEAAQRTTLSQAERDVIERLTNSNTAEVRQFIFGQVMRSHMVNFIADLTGTFKKEVYLDVVGQIFSVLKPSIFNRFIHDAFTDRSAEDNVRLRKKYAEYLDLNL